MRDKTDMSLFDINAAVKECEKPAYGYRYHEIVESIIKAAIGDKHLIEAPVEEDWDGIEPLRVGHRVIFAETQALIIYYNERHDIYMGFLKIQVVI